MKIVYQGEFPGVVVAVDGESLAFKRGEPRDVSDAQAERLLEENPTIWRAEKPAKTEKPAPDSKESK